MAEIKDDELDDIWENVSFLYRNYAMCDDDNLTGDAQVLKREIIKRLKYVSMLFYEDDEEIEQAYKRAKEAE